MTSSTTTAATSFQRVAATLANFAIVGALFFAAEFIGASAGAPSAAARTAIAFKALLGLTGLFWLICGHLRTSPGLILLKIRVVPADPGHGRISLATALIRPLPFFLFGIVLFYPQQLLPQSLAPVQFIVVLISSLLLAANCTPLWSGPNRFSLLDRWLKTRVVAQSAGTTPPPGL